MTLSEKILNNSAYAEVYRQGREDAINEFLEREMRCPGTEQECLHGNDDFSCVQCIVEQIKEQKK